MEAPTSLTSLPLGQILKGRYVAPYRSRKGKIKGLQLQIGEITYAIKLPKYLRPILVRELKPDTFVMVWAYREDDIWQGVNVLPLSAEEAENLQRQWHNYPPQSLTVSSQAVVDSIPVESTQPSRPRQQCIKVCRKGKCFKQGGKHIWSVLQSEVETNPDLQHVSIEATGCMKACKHGPNLKVMPKGKMHTGMTPEQALEVLASCQ